MRKVCWDLKNIQNDCRKSLKAIPSHLKSFSFTSNTTHNGIWEFGRSLLGYRRHNEHRLFQNLWFIKPYKCRFLSHQWPASHDLPDCRWCESSWRLIDRFTRVYIEEKHLYVVVVINRHRSWSDLYNLQEPRAHLDLCLKWSDLE